MEAERMTFKVFNDQGKEVECEALFTFESEEEGKNYIVYTDNTKDTEGNIRVYAGTYTPEAENMMLKPIETDKEWKIIENILAELQEEYKGAGQ